MNDYLRVSGELSPDLEYELLVNGKSIAKKKITGADVFNAPSQFTVDPKLIKDGENDIRIVRQGRQGADLFRGEREIFQPGGADHAGGQRDFCAAAVLQTRGPAHAAEGLRV